MDVDELRSSEKGVGPSLGEVLRHMVVHEVHPIGQLSIWAQARTELSVGQLH